MKTVHKAGIGAGAILVCLTFTPMWEGTDLVAKRDMIGTGNPITYCNGLTAVDGSVRVGEKFTSAQCRALLNKALPKYWNGIEPCIHVDIPVKTAAALLDAAFNAGPAAVCRSPMLERINAGDIFGGCDAFAGWYVHASGRVVPGLINRRKGDNREGERGLCLEGANEKPKPITKISMFTRFVNYLKEIL